MYVLVGVKVNADCPQMRGDGPMDSRSFDKLFSCFWENKPYEPNGAVCEDSILLVCVDLSTAPAKLCIAAFDAVDTFAAALGSPIESRPEGLRKSLPSTYQLFNPTFSGAFPPLKPNPRAYFPIRSPKEDLYYTLLMAYYAIVDQCISSFPETTRRMARDVNEHRVFKDQAVVVSRVLHRQTTFKERQDTQIDASVATSKQMTEPGYCRKVEEGVATSDHNADLNLVEIKAGFTQTGQHQYKHMIDT